MAPFPRNQSISYLEMASRYNFNAGFLILKSGEKEAEIS